MNIYFILVGFENNYPLSIKFTLTDLLNENYKDANTEIFYSLKELHAIDVETMNMYDIIPVQLSRDNENNKGLLTRVSELKYKAATT